MLKKLGFWILLPLFSNSQPFLFETSFSRGDVWANYYATQDQGGNQYSEFFRKVVDIYTKKEDTTEYVRSNIKGQTNFILYKNNFGVPQYGCYIYYKTREREDMLFRSDDTVDVDHYVYYPFEVSMKINSITASKDGKHLKFYADSNYVFHIKTTLFFSNKRNTIRIMYQDLNDPKKASFEKIFFRRDEMFILKK